jgi:hypothetical protein
MEGNVLNVIEVVPIVFRHLSLAAFLKRDLLPIGPTVSRNVDFDFPGGV